MFAPGIDRRKVEKAVGLGVDVVILDLEDSVDTSRKAEAREIVVSVLKDRNTAKELWVRINPPETDFFLGDIMDVVAARPDGIMMPKAESAEGVARVDWIIGLLEARHGIEKGSIDLVPLVESARGIKSAGEIAAGSDRVKRLSFGAVDYTLDMGIELTKDTAELFYARSALAVASRSAGLEGPIDTVYTDVKDSEGLSADCRLGRSLGFQGKLVIHPAQVEVVNSVFSPTAEELARARKIVEVYEEALAAGSGVAQLNGKLIEKPVALRARRILEVARSLGLEVI